MTRPTQRKQSEWHDQWSMLQDDETRLFLDWIQPMALEDLRGKTVLDGGCGGGQHTVFMAPYASQITAVDLNTVDIARRRAKGLTNIRFVEADLERLELKEKFDVVLSVGVVHHTDDPDATVRNLIRHLKPGGRLVLWVYSKEGNGLVEYLLEPFRKHGLRHWPRKWLLRLSQLITVGLMISVYTLYRLPLPFLPYYRYFMNFRRLSFGRNVLNVFDKLNAPQVQFISRERAERWLRYADFEFKHISDYCGVSWRISGISASPV